MTTPTDNMKVDYEPLSLLPRNSAVSGFEEQNELALQMQQTCIEKLQCEIRKLEAALEAKKAERSQLMATEKVLKKRRNACYRGKMTEIKLAARRDAANLNDALCSLANSRVEGECDQMTTRGKCTSRRSVKPLKSDGTNACSKCRERLAEYFYFLPLSSDQFL